eukprot:3430920-Rhodomonas_salina.1
MCIRDSQGGRAERPGGGGRVSKLHDCLWAILEDGEVEVRGIKNMLRDNFNPDWSAGFRAVTLSLSLETATTKELALAQHVCELQLILEPMLKVQAQCSHRAYIIFRDTRSLKAASPFSRLYYTQVPLPSPRPARSRCAASAGEAVVRC